MTRSHDPVAMAAAHERLRNTPISSDEKGFLAVGPVTPRQLADRGATVFEAGFTTPLMVIRGDALRTNVKVMAEWCERHGAFLAPHAKATMVPQIIEQQLSAGAWGITVANVNQLSSLYAFGVRRFLIANQVTDPVALAWLARTRSNDPGLDVACYLDSEAGARLLADAVGSRGRPMPVLIELGFIGGRTGVRDIEEVRILARHASGLGLLVCGVAGFEGTLGHDRSADALSSVRAFCRELGAAAEALGDLPRDERDDGGFSAGGIISAGGSVFFDVVADELLPGSPGTRLVIRSGGYVVQDRGYLGMHSPLAGKGLEPAFETWAAVLSRPEPELVFLGAGKRDLPFDLGMPDVLGTVDGAAYGDLPGARLLQLDDQHAYLWVPGAVQLGPGQIVRLGGAHPCTAFDKWRAIPVIDAQDRVVDVAQTLF